LAPIPAILKDRAVSAFDKIDRERVLVNRLNRSCVRTARKSARPSTESYMHAILDRFTVHLHPLTVGPYICSRNGRTVLEKLFKNEGQPLLWVPYAATGYMLARRLAKFVSGSEKVRGRKPQVIFLQKHGLVVTADTAESVLCTVRRVIKVCTSKLRRQRVGELKRASQDQILAAKRAIKRAMAAVTGARISVEHFDDSDILSFLARKDAEKLVRLPALVPQEISYANGPPMWLSQWDYKTVLSRLKRQKAKRRTVPAGFLVKDMGLFVVGSKKSIPTTKHVMTVSLLTRTWAEQFGGVNPLNKHQREFVETIYPFKLAL
jgi:rhamnose utilization protein RhaD (predicted bifunctional aldolase and dehydrogenase)